MSLSKETIAWIAELSGVKAEDITAGITGDKEFTIAKPEGQLFSDDDLTKRDGSKYREGKEAGSEMLIKGLKQKYGYEIDGKDADSFMSHHDEQLKGKYSKGSNERVNELEADLKRQKSTFEEEITGYKTKVETLETDTRNQKIDNSLLFASPKEMTMDAKRVVSLFKMENPPVEVDGVIGIQGKDGQPIKNPKTGEVVPHTEVYKEWVVKENFVKGSSGRGGGNEFGDGNSTYSAKDPSAFQKEWSEKNPDKSVNSPQFQKDFAEWDKESTAA